MSVFCFRHSYNKSWTVLSSCQLICYTYWRFCSSWQWDFRIVVQKREEIFCDMEESMVSVLWLCVYTGKWFFQYYKEKETKYLMIGSQLTDWLTDSVTDWLTESLLRQEVIWQAFCIHKLKRLHAIVMDPVVMDVATGVFHVLNCIRMVVHIIWFGVLLFVSRWMLQCVMQWDLKFFCLWFGR